MGLRVLRHELKNVLCAASIHLDLLADRRGDGSRDQIAALRDALSQALGLSDRLQRDSQAEAEMTVDLSDLVSQCVRLARPGVERLGTLRASIAGSVGRVALSEVEGREMVLNLILNAGQALEPGGRVRVSLTPVDGHRRVRLVVADNGVGMSPETLGRATTPGFTLRPDGMGLGLSRVRALVDQLGGDLRIRSRAGC
jgi:signal transduction histidine kinase